MLWYVCTLKPLQVEIDINLAADWLPSQRPNETLTPPATKIVWHLGWLLRFGRNQMKQRTARSSHGVGSELSASYPKIGWSNPLRITHIMCLHNFRYIHVCIYIYCFIYLCVYIYIFIYACIYILYIEQRVWARKSDEHSWALFSTFSLS